MKLKKIASLALAGIMAVSMLAGCNTANETPEEPNTPVVPTTSSIGDYMNNLMNGDQKKILTFEENADLSAAVAKVAMDSGVVTPLIITDAKDTLDGTYFANASAQKTDIAKKVKAEFKNGVIYTGLNWFNDWNGKAIDNQEKSDSLLYVYVLSGDLSEVGVANLLYGKMGPQIGDDADKLPNTNNGDYVDYTASVAATKVSNSVNASESAWVVGVMFTRTVTNGTNTQA